MTLDLIDDQISEEEREIHKAVMRWECKDAVELIRQVGVGAGNCALDVGCGNGHYTIPCAKCVGDMGLVHALDKERKALRALEDKIHRYEFANVNAIHADASNGFPLSDACVDFVLLYDIIHMETKDNILGNSHPVRYSLYREARRVLKKCGILSVLTFDSELRSVPFEDGGWRKLTYRDMAEEISAYGFSLSHHVENGVHFDWYHSKHRMNKGIRFADLERGVIRNFKKS